MVSFWTEQGVSLREVVEVCLGVPHCIGPIAALQLRIDGGLDDAALDVSGASIFVRGLGLRCEVLLRPVPQDLGRGDMFGGRCGRVDKVGD